MYLFFFTLVWTLKSGPNMCHPHKRDLGFVKWPLPRGRSSWRKIRSLSKLPPTKLEVTEEVDLVCKAKEKNTTWVMASSGCLQPQFVTRLLISIMCNGGSSTSKHTSIGAERSTRRLILVRLELKSFTKSACLAESNLCSFWLETKI